jgi:hypothetical protein
MRTYPTLQVVAVVPVEQEHPFPVPGFNEYYDTVTLYPRDGRDGPSQADQLKDIARRALDKLQLTTPRTAPLPVRVVIYKLVIEAGHQVRQQIYDLPTMPALTAMTQAEFDHDQQQALYELPAEFRGFVSSYAWEHGHAAGYEEVLGYVRELVSALRPCITAHNKACLLARPALPPEGDHRG